VPVDARLDVQAPRPGEQLVRLGYTGPAKAALDSHRAAQGSFLHDLDAGGAGDLISLPLVALVYIPGIPIGRLVRVDPQAVATAVEDLASLYFVVDAPEVAVI
jgi:hypothetical protein